MVTQPSNESGPRAIRGSVSDDAVRTAAWHVIPLLAVGYIVSYIDRANVGFAALTMNRDLGLSATQFGFAAGTFYFGYCLFEVPSNLALRRFGARRWLARIMISWGLAAAATSLAAGPVSFSACRFLTGACEAGFYPGVMFYLSTWFPIEVRARVFAWFNLANPMSSVISGPVSAALLKMHGIGGFAGWRWLLLCEGLPACALGLYTLYALPDRPRDARWLTDEQKDALEKRLSEESHPRASHNVWAALRDPRVLILTFSYFCLIVGVLGVTLWLPQMLRQRGLSTTAIGFTSALPYLVASIGMIIWSIHIDRSRAYLGNYVTGCAVAAGGFALSVAVDSLPIMLVGISLALVGMNSCRPAIFSLLPRFLQGAAAAAGMAFVNSVGNLGGFFGPYLIGWLKDTTGSFTAGLYGLAGMLTLAALSAPLIRLVRRDPISAQSKEGLCEE
jgi:ACS family tartrate transporter-like MFS transporter